MLYTGQMTRVVKRVTVQPSTQETIDVGDAYGGFTILVKGGVTSNLGVMVDNIAAAVPLDNGIPTYHDFYADVVAVEETGGTAVAEVVVVYYVPWEK